MATWKMVRDFVVQNYASVEIDGKAIKFPLKIEEGRFQKMLLVHDEDARGDGWLQVVSPLGLVSQYEPGPLLTYASQFICGGIVIYNENNLVLRHSIPLEEMSPDEMTLPISMVAIAADAIEKQFLGTDEN